MGRMNGVGILPSRVPRNRVSGLWGNILRVGDLSSFGLVVGKVFSGIVGYKVGRGVVCVRFDDCLGKGPLFGVYPRLITVVVNKLSSVKQNYKAGRFCVLGSVI